MLSVSPTHPSRLADEIDQLLYGMDGGVDDPAALLAEVERALRGRGILFGGDRVIPTFLRPHLVEPSLHDRWVAESEAFFRLLERIAAQVIHDDALARWLGFGAPELELFRIDPGYPTQVVVARPDAVDDRGALRFLEVNCDSPAMMTFADEIEEILLALSPFAPLRGRLGPTRRVEALYAALLECHRARTASSPATIAIVDWPGEKTARELARTAERFAALGSETVVCGPAALRFDGRRLYAGDRAIDLVYRRVLFRDFLTRKDELAPLVAAYRAGAVTMANPLRSYAVGSKALLALLHDPDNAAGLVPAERLLVERLVPKTIYQRGRTPGAAERQQWVLKKAESYGGQNVVVGPLVDAETWERALASAAESAWVRQALVEVPRWAVPVLDGKRLRPVEKFVNWNPFLFSGRFGGAIARVSDSLLINISLGGGLLPSLRG